MRIPNHIILDFPLINNSSMTYWFLDTTNTPNLNQPSIFNNGLLLQNLNNLTTYKLMRETKFNIKPAKSLALVGVRCNLVQSQFNNFFPLNNLININFLRKERLYTKLKYSRSPAYDIVSGGAAALFAGLLGFLTSEKFGFELVDSGDFYYLFMYLVFLVFALRPLVTVANFNKPLSYIFSIRWLFNYLKTITLLLLKLF